MACFHPLPAVFKYPPDPRKPVYVGKENEILSPTLIKETGELLEPFKVPCGRCIGCRLDYSRFWADRLVMESLTLPENQSWFVTLTYDPQYESELCSFASDGTPVLSLKPDHFRKFIKDFRRYFEYHYDLHDLRFYLAGEYGDRNHRPHFHFLLFGVDLEPFLEPWFVNQNHDQIYTCDLISDIWKYGIVAVGKCTWQSCAYTARYVLKKRKGPDAGFSYLAAGLEPEYCACSNHPGIGFSFFQDHKLDFLEGKTLYLPSVAGHDMPIRIPRYFLKLLDQEFPDQTARLKSERLQIALNADDVRHAQTTLTDKEYFSLGEKSRLNSAKKLLRNLE